MNPFYKDDYIKNRYELFNELLKLNWIQATEARKEYFMHDGKIAYIYGKGIGKRTYYSEEYHPDVANLQKELNADFGTHYDICFLNRYDNDKSQLGWHADDSYTMDKNHPIAVLSLGTVREIWWKLQGEKGVVPQNQRQLLSSGSLFIMPAGFQELYYHRIPKCDHPCGTRISLTFRKYKYE